MAPLPLTQKEQRQFPNLSQSNHDKTSERDPAYNCIAWVVGRTNEYWQPPCLGFSGWDPGPPRVFFNWPSGNDDLTVQTLVALYAAEGYQPCTDASLEPGIEKIAIYADGGEWQHAALQLPDGRFVRKL